MTFFEVLKIHIKNTKHVENYFHVENFSENLIIYGFTLVVLLLTLNMLLSVG